MSALHSRLEQYLALRRSLGFKLERSALWLPDFVTYLERKGAHVITTDLALEWAKQARSGRPTAWARRLALVRSFAEYLSAIDSRNEIPDREVFPISSRRATPYLYSDRDVVQLMNAARSAMVLLRGQTYATLIGLLAVTGMRVGEAIALDREDVDWTQRALIVRSGKFRRKREIPLHQTTCSALRAYARLRDREVSHVRAAAFFLSTTGSRLIYKNVHFGFQRLIRAAFAPQCSPRRQPRIHDLRHSFAVRTLVSWYRAGVDVEALLPRLSTYLGHVSPVSTYWYLSASPELLALAAKRADRARRSIP
jgi:integrase/recombinase XerD